MSVYFVILFMLFCHVLDDYTLQGWLASGKQKSFWKENAPDALYKYDYIMALIMHSISWSFMIMLPLAVYLAFEITVPFVIIFFANVLVHAVVDDLKANRKVINLIVDQSIHLIQIFTTAVLVLYCI